MEEQREQLKYNDTVVPIVRENCQEIYAALEPPAATPYIVAPHGAQVQSIVDFFVPLIPKMEAQIDDTVRNRLKEIAERLADISLK